MGPMVRGMRVLQPLPPHRWIRPAPVKILGSCLLKYRRVVVKSCVIESLASVVLNFSVWP